MNLCDYAKAVWNRSFRGKQWAEMVQAVKVEHNLAAGTWSAEARLELEKGRPLMEAMIKAFRLSGAINYCSLAALDPVSLETYTITVQRKSGMDPGHVTAILRQALECILSSQTDDPVDTARRALYRCGYLADAEAREPR